MAKLTTAFLLLNSILFFTSSCHCIKQAGVSDLATPCPTVLNQRIETATYNTEVDFYKRHTSGLLVFKALNDTTKRAVFITETGFKFFDLQFTTNTFSVQYCISALNKKIVIKTLRKDLGYLLNARNDKAVLVSKNDSMITYKFEPSGKDVDYYTADAACKKLLAIERRKGRHKNLTITFTGIDGDPLNAIIIQHHPIKLKISIKRISQ